MKSGFIWSRDVQRVLLPALLVLMFWRELDSLWVTSPTYDEYTYVARGYTYLKTQDPRLKMRHPILVDGFAALPLLLEPDIRLPLDDDGWRDGDFHTYSHAFLWEANAAKADKIMWLSRYPIILLSLLLAAAVARWSRELYGCSAALLAVFLYTFDPTILAHGRLVTPDIGQTTLIFMAALTWWRYLERPVLGHLLLGGVVLGLAQTAGFPALVAYPIFPLAVLLRERGTGPEWWRSVVTRWLQFVGAVAVSFVTVWAVYGFSWGPVEGLGLSLPAPYHWEELLDLVTRMQRQDLAYCCGEVYRGGKLWFFPLAFLIKMPVATLILLATGVWGLYRYRSSSRRVILVWLLPLLYFGNAVRSSLNIGYRHILPILPFLFVIAAGAVRLLRRRALTQTLSLALCGWLAVASVGMHPYYLAYFSEVVGGPDEGYRYLAVSDLDWGQDLPGLRDYVQEHDVDTLYLSWFGTTPPEHYGLDYQRLPSWPPPEHLEQVAWHADYPLPGTYAISVANLVAARLPGQDPFAAFRAKEPQARIGYSVYIYEVPAKPEGDQAPVPLTLSGIAYPDVPAEIIEAHFKTNDVQLRWADARRGLVLAPGDGYVIVDDETAAVSSVLQYLQASGTLFEIDRWQDSDGAGFQLHGVRGVTGAPLKMLTADVDLAADLVPTKGISVAQTLPVSFGGQLALLGYRWLEDPSSCSGQVLPSVWRVEDQLRGSLSMFLHLLAEDGSILAQDDCLDVVPAACRVGDIVVQFFDPRTVSQQAPVPAAVELGVYDRDTLERLMIAAPVADAIRTDRVLLSSSQ